MPSSSGDSAMATSPDHQQQQQHQSLLQSLLRGNVGAGASSLSMEAILSGAAAAANGTSRKISI
jgi:hypothetical protein